MPKFNRKQQYITPSGRKFGKGVWYDDNGKLIRPGQGFYDKATKTVTQYNSDGTISRLSRQQWAKRKQADTEMRTLQNDRRYAIPFIPEKKMTIHIDKNSPTARNRGAVISENLLDSIAVNAKKAGLPFRDAIGMASQESTLGGGNRKVGQSLQPWLQTLNASPRRAEGNKISYRGVQSPSLLISNWKPYTERHYAPYAEYLYDSHLNLRRTPQSNNYFEQNFRGSLFMGNRQVPENASPLYQGYRSYKKDPTTYNRGDKDYPNKVRRAGDELVKYSPEIRNYMRKHNIHADGGSLEGLRKWDELSLEEKSEIMRTAVQRGITRLDEIRKAYNEYAEGGAMPPTVGQYADEIYEDSMEEPYGDPSPHYDNVDVEMVKRLVPDARGHYDDIVKLPNHPSSPERGTFNGQYFDLTDAGMADPNYTLFGLIDNGDAGTILRYNGDYVLPEVTVTPEGNYYDDTYNNIMIKPKVHGMGGNLFKGGGSLRDQRASQAISYFMNKGLTREQAAGLVGNFMRESQLNPNALNKYSGAYGLGQWLGARKANLFKRYGKNPTFENQLDYVWDELNSTHKRGLKMLRQSKTVDDAARNVFGYYEFSAGPEAAVAAMNRSGMGTKWKNPDGTLAMNTGINYAHAAFNRNTGSRNVIPAIQKVDFQGIVNDIQPSATPQADVSLDDIGSKGLFAMNPTDYGTPVEYNIPERKVDNAISEDYGTGDYGTRLLGFMNALGILGDSNNSQPLASYTPRKEG